MEVRTRKVIHRCFLSDGGKTCGRSRVLDNGNFYHTRYARPRRSGEINSPRYRIIEPREPLRSKPRVNIPGRRRLSPIRSEQYKMRFPFVRRVTEPRGNRYEYESRGRTRSPRLFVVDPPEERTSQPRRTYRRSPSPQIHIVSPRTRSFSPRIRSISPRTRISSESKDRKMPDELYESHRESRTMERPKAARRPRERTPVVERRPIKRPQRSPVVVHDPPSGDRDRSRSSGRQVRFSSEVEYEKNSNRARDQQESNDTRTRLRSPPLRRNTGSSSSIDDMPRRQRLSSDTRASSPQPRRPGDFVRRNTAPDRSRPRPRIIQDGNREISAAGARVYAQARRRRSRDSFIRDFMLSDDSVTWNRRSDYSEDGSLLSGRSRRYNWRWR